MKELDLSKSVAELVSVYPELKEIMVGLGFKDITSPVALKFMGRVMTIPKGAAIKGIPMEKTVAAFEENGFHVTGVPGHEGDTLPRGRWENSDCPPIQRCAMVALLRYRSHTRYFWRLPQKRMSEGTRCTRRIFPHLK